MKRARIIVALGLVAVALALGWRLLTPPEAQSLNAADVRSVEVWFEPWGEDESRRLAVQSSDPEAIAGLLRAVQSGERTRDHKCGSRGIVYLKTSMRPPLTLRFLPGHDATYYEYRRGDRAYRVPRSEFVTAMRNLGVEVPLECQ